MNNQELKLGVSKEVFLDNGLELLESVAGIYEVLQFEDEDEELRVVEDDGNLHISAYGIRYCIDLGQDTPRFEYKRVAEKCLNALKVTGYEVQGS